MWPKMHQIDKKNSIHSIHDFCFFNLFFVVFIPFLYILKFIVQSWLVAGLDNVGCLLSLFHQCLRSVEDGQAGNSIRRFTCT